MLANSFTIPRPRDWNYRSCDSATVLRGLLFRTSLILLGEFLKEGLDRQRRLVCGYLKMGRDEPALRRDRFEQTRLVVESGRGARQISHALRCLGE